MKTKLLAVPFLIWGMLGGSVALAQYGGSIALDQFDIDVAALRGFVESELIDKAGSCYVRTTSTSGRVHEIPCDDLDSIADLEEYGDRAWNNFCERDGRFLSPEQYQKYCGNRPVVRHAVQVTDQVAFSPIGAHVDAGYVMTNPFKRGFLATEVLGTLVNPAFDVDYSLSGYRVGLGFDAQLSIDKFSPFKVSAGFEYGTLSGSGSTSGVMLDNFGVTSVGATPGVFADWPTDVLGANFMVDRTFASLGTKVSFPLVSGNHDLASTGLGGTFSDLDYDLYAIAGKRLGYFNQTEQTTISTSTPAFPSPLTDIRYDTQFDGTFVGAQIGLGLDKRLPLVSSDLVIEESFALLVGYDYYRLGVTDSVNSVGVLNHNSTNSFDVGVGVPTFQFTSSVGIGNGKWYAGVKGGVAAGLHPELNYNRPDSEAPATALQPTLELRPGFSYEFSADFRLRF